MVTDDLTRDGYAIIADFFPKLRLAPLVTELDQVQMEGKAGLRDACGQLSTVAAIRRHPKLVQLASTILGGHAFVVRTLLFDKTPDSNWKVAWHQDLTICVRDQAEVEGFGPWSVKAGIHHVQPPVEVLERMITIRLHLDDCDVDNGALRVIPGSHRSGRLRPEQISEMRNMCPEVVAEISSGGLLIMRPLLLHASSAAVSPRHRRVLHLEWAAGDLPGGLEWYERKLEN